MLTKSELITKSVLKVFYDVLGEPAARAILNYAYLNPEDLVNHPSHFTQSLQIAFGPSAHHLEQAVVRELLRRFNITHKTLGEPTYEKTISIILRTAENPKHKVTSKVKREVTHKTHNHPTYSPKHEKEESR